MKKKKIKVGGVALFNGILFSSTNREVIASRNGNKISCKCQEYSKKTNIVSHIPIIRWILNLVLQVGNAGPEFTSSYDSKEKTSSLSTIIFYCLFMLIILGLPILLSAFFSIKYRTLVQVIILLVEILIYAIMLKSTDELDNLFMYHGAEHKVVNAFENDNIQGLTLENIKKQSRFHKRCGGNFVTYFMILTIICFLIPIDNLAVKYISLICISLLNVGIAYEIVVITSLLPKPLDVLAYPGCLIQLFTTKEPTDDMLELARYGTLAAVRENPGIVVSEYVNSYIDKNLKHKEYDIQDIYKILAYVTNTDKNSLYLQKNEKIITINQEIEAEKLLDKYYNQDYPLQYITNKQYFYNEEYYVDERVLIPRQDTEILVEKALEYIEKENLVNVIDLCTGSGCIGISIAKNSKNDCYVELVDISSDAICVANRNIAQNNVENKVKTVISNLLEYRIKQDTEYKVDMIVSNPPYIQSEVIKELDKKVQKEPLLALDGGKDGLDFYIRILNEAKQVLKPNGIIMFEIGYDELQAITDIINKDKEYKLLESVKDYGGNDRVVICRFLEK